MIISSYLQITFFSLQQLQYGLNPRGNSDFLLSALFFSLQSTFSKETARNMREKVKKLLQGNEVIVKTFHSFRAELIKDHAERCKVPVHFKIFEA
jgi:hypothetical protein